MAISQKTFDKRKQRIIKSAEKLFVSNGFMEVSMDNIAKQARLSKPTLYNYFESKLDIYYICLVTAYTHRWNKTKPKNDNGKTGFELVEEYSRNLIEYGYNYPEHLLFTSNVNEYNFEVLVFHKAVSSKIIEEYNPQFLAAKSAYSNMFIRGFEDNSIKKKPNINIEIYFLYSLRGYIVERISALVKLKNRGKLYFQEEFDVKKLLMMSRAEIDFHLNILLDLIRE